MSKQDTITGNNHSDNYCYYYLHTNGDLISKSQHYEVADFEESDFVKKWWLVDLENRADAYNMLILAWVMNASITRIKELMKNWKINNDDAKIYCEKVGLVWEMDGNCFCVHEPEPDFVNIQESPCGFSEELFWAISEYYKSAVEVE